MDKKQEREIMAVTRLYCTDEEIEALGWTPAAMLATARDITAAESLRLDCEG
jgi:hypothetical protein